MDHFAHEHPLIFKESEEAIPHCCNACGLCVLSSPYYFCAIQDCNFFLHQACSQLPGKLYRYFLRRSYGTVKKHTLDLLAKPRDDNCRCGDCGKLCKNFTYHCSKCEFVLHPQCGFPLDIQIKHISHSQHPMVAMRKEALLLCDVCGRDHEGYFFSCHQCDFWIHQDCALLPIVAKVEEHRHHLSLFYSTAALSSRYMTYGECLICGEMALERYGVYCCFICNVIVHVDCITSHIVKRNRLDRFAHEHPLIFNELEEEIPHCCNACGLRVLSSPYYFCSIQDCSFYLHQACSKLPEKSYHYFFRGTYGTVKEHTLDLLAKPRDDNCRCGDCGKLCKNFTYHCSECEFVLHPLCGSPLDIQIKHISHPQHPMVALCKEALLLCHVCGRKHEGYFFSCHQCHFWIHQDCALLPILAKVEEHHHHLSLFYSAAALSGLYIRDRKCLICGEMALKRFGLYYCLMCDVVAHVDCTTSRMKDSGAVLHLPTKLDDKFPSLMMRTGVKEMAVQESNSKDMLEKYHAHSLVLTDRSTAQESICNACVKPISPPYYNCSECNFLLHKFCAELPLSIEHPLYRSDPGNLASTRWDGFFQLFKCYRCKKYNNGFGYSFDDEREVDIDCAFAPIIITHDSHKQHPLILINENIYGTHISCCGREKKYYDYTYHCSVCKLCIHIDCARLPKTVTHKFDKHPLTLTDASSDSQHHSNTTDDHLCEFCENNINPKYWFYHCSECDQSFHVECIPSTGEYSRIKFGGTMKVPCHSDHPLTLVRTMNVCSQTCGYCHEIIHGFQDGTALHCTDCDFWIHLDCGYESSGAIVPSPAKLKPFL